MRDREPLALAFVALLAAACGPDPTNDLDNDGYRIWEDCDDANAQVHPYAEEVCDGIDNDCDELIDEEDATDPSAWYMDYDGDGFGSADYALWACDQPRGYIADSSDCDDGDGYNHPEADERCDGVDNDCDDEVDEDDAADASTWYPDADGDGYGDPDSGLVACSQPKGYLDEASDCDDDDASLYPGADEACDRIDNDCDGQIDEDFDADGDGYASADECKDGLDCDDDDANDNPDADERCDGEDNDCDGTIDEELALCGQQILGEGMAKLVGEADGDCAGAALSSGDVDGDGLNDLLIGAWGADGGASASGAAYLLLASGLTKKTGERDLSTAEAVLLGENGSDYAGASVAADGDADGDGYHDLLVGAWGHDGSGSAAGAAYLALGPISGSVSLTQAEAQLLGEQTHDNAGSSLAWAGDLDGDGQHELLIGAPGYPAGEDQGAAYLLYGPQSGARELASDDLLLSGEQAARQLGQAVSGAGDTDGDGFDDLLVGAPGAGESGSLHGAAYLLLGPDGVGRAELSGEGAGDGAGSAVAAAGDVDADGYGDLLVGAADEESGGSAAGAAYLLLGPLSGSTDLAAAQAKLKGEADDDRAGCSVAGLGDIDGDGWDDIAVGAEQESATYSMAGATYLLLGPVSGSLSLADAHGKLQGEAAGDRAGRAISPSGDLDADGFADFLVGATYEDAGGSSAGAAYLLLGERM